MLAGKVSEASFPARSPASIPDAETWTNQSPLPGIDPADIFRTPYLFANKNSRERASLSYPYTILFLIEIGQSLRCAATAEFRRRSKRAESGFRPRTRVSPVGCDAFCRTQRGQSLAARHPRGAARKDMSQRANKKGPGGAGPSVRPARAPIAEFRPSGPRRRSSCRAACRRQLPRPRQARGCRPAC
jgi:hypothetical protein